MQLWLQFVQLVNADAFSSSVLEKELRIFTTQIISSVMVSDSNEEIIQLFIN